MKKVSIERIAEDVKKVKNLPPSSMLAYQEFIVYFEGLKQVKCHHLFEHFDYIMSEYEAFHRGVD